MRVHVYRERIGRLAGKRRDRTRDPDLFLLATLIPWSDGWFGVGAGRSGASLCPFSLPSSHLAYFRLLFRAEDAFRSDLRVSKGNANNLEILAFTFRLQYRRENEQPGRLSGSRTFSASRSRIISKRERERRRRISSSSKFRNVFVVLFPPVATFSTFRR